jgi:hypothetical protein
MFLRSILVAASDLFPYLHRVSGFCGTLHMFNLLLRNLQHRPNLIVDLSAVRNFGVVF